MIVITSLSPSVFHLHSGDRFTLNVQDELGGEILINEEIKVDRVIDFIASYRFALGDGTVTGFHLAGIFANKKELPQEIQNAVMFNDLAPAKQKRFVESCGLAAPNTTWRG